MSRYIDAEAWLKNIECTNEFLDTLKHKIADAPHIDIVKCKECRWARPKTLKGETGYRCIFYRTRKAENGYCDCGEHKTEQAERVETMSCQECKWWFTDSLKHGGYCQSLLYNHECRYEPEVDCSWK